MTWRERPTWRTIRDLCLVSSALCFLITGVGAFFEMTRRGQHTFSSAGWCLFVVAALLTVTVKTPKGRP